MDSITTENFLRSCDQKAYEPLKNKRLKNGKGEGGGMNFLRNDTLPLLSHITVQEVINPSNPELNPICYLLVLLGAYHFLHVSRIRVKFS